MGDLFDVQSLFPQLVLAIGAALAGGNGYALYQARRGHRPRGEHGELRAGRAWFLLVAGVVMALWGLASLLT